MSMRGLRGWQTTYREHSITTIINSNPHCSVVNLTVYTIILGLMTPGVTCLVSRIYTSATIISATSFMVWTAAVVETHRVSRSSAMTLDTIPT